MLSIPEIRAVYSRTAAHYDRTVKAFPAFGVRIGRYRRAAVAALHLKPGATVVELGCGTGLNFALLQDAIGPGGRIIGVDLTRAMLEQARKRIAARNWRNVDLVESDFAEYSFPDEVDDVLSTFALTLSPSYDRVIQRVIGGLRPGGRFVVLDLKWPQAWPEWLVRFAAWLNRPFAVTVDLAERQPWESMRTRMNLLELRDFYFGALYLAVAERRTTSGELFETVKEPPAAAGVHT